MFYILLWWDDDIHGSSVTDRADRARGRAYRGAAMILVKVAKTKVEAAAVSDMTS